MDNLDGQRQRIYALVDAGHTTTEIMSRTGLSRSYVNKLIRNRYKPATKKAAAKNRPSDDDTRTARICLRCGRRFLSEGPHNRICNQYNCQTMTEERRFY
jgi:hypothetical protein